MPSPSSAGKSGSQAQLSRPSCALGSWSGCSTHSQLPVGATCPAAPHPGPSRPSQALTLKPQTAVSAAGQGPARAKALPKASPSLFLATSGAPARLGKGRSQGILNDFTKVQGRRRCPGVAQHCQHRPPCRDVGLHSRPFQMWRSLPRPVSGGPAPPPSLSTLGTHMQPHKGLSRAPRATLRRGEGKGLSGQLATPWLCKEASSRLRMKWAFPPYPGRPTLRLRGGGAVGGWQHLLRSKAVGLRAGREVFHRPRHPAVCSSNYLTSPPATLGLGPLLLYPLPTLGCLHTPRKEAGQSGDRDPCPPPPPPPGVPRFC